MNFYKLCVRVVMLLSALLLVACGGSDDSKKPPPPVSLQPIHSEAISVQFVAPNRINSEGTITINLQSFTREGEISSVKWEHPHFNLTKQKNDNKLVLTAPKVEQDTNYQIAVEIRDSANNIMRHVHDIRVLRRVSTVTITGIVTDTVIANAKVSAWLGNQKLAEIDANENGIYELSLTLEENTAVTQPVELRASGDESRGQGFVEFRSLIPSLTSLIADSGQTNSANVTIDTSVDFGVNITNVTSAVSSLLPKTPLESDQALNQALLSINTAEVLRRATLIKLLVDKPAEYSLPAGVNNTLVFLQDSDAKQQIQEQATAGGNTDFDDTQKQILEDKQLVSDNAKLAAAEYIVQLDPDAFALHLNADGTGQIHAYTSSNITWSYANRIHTITVANPVETYRDEDGWLKRLKKMELQVINQSNGRAMASITRVFDRYENGVFQDEFRFENDSAVVIDKRNTLLIPYAQLLGDWEVTEQMWGAEPQAPFILQFFENGLGLDVEDQEEFNWGVQNNRIIFSNTNQQGKQETSQLWFTGLTGDDYSFYLENPHAAAEELPIYYGTMRRVGDNTQPGANSEKLTPATQYIVQDHSIAFAIQLDQDGTGNIKADTSSRITWQYSEVNNRYLINIENPVQIETEQHRVLKLIQVEISNLKKHNSSLTSTLATHSVWYSIGGQNSVPLENLHRMEEDATIFDAGLPFLLTASEFLGYWQITENSYQGETFAIRVDSGGSLYNYAEDSTENWQLTDNRLLMSYQDQDKHGTTEIWLTAQINSEVNDNPVYRFFAFDQFDGDLTPIMLHGTFAKLSEPSYQPDSGSLSQQADIQDPALAQCIDESGYPHLSLIRDLSCADSSQPAIGSLQGLSNITGLEKLHIGYLSYLHLSPDDFPPSLQVLTIDNSQLFSVDLDGLDQLRELYIRDSEIFYIDFALLTQLRKLTLSNNININSVMDLSPLTALQRLDLSDNQLTEINLKGLNQLTHLFVENNELTALDLSDNLSLQHVEASTNKLQYLNLSQLDKLTYLALNNNQLTSVDLNGLGQLTYLYIGNNQLAALDLTDNLNLQQLFAWDNNLHHLNLSQQGKLTYLVLKSNQLTNVDLNGLVQLTHLFVDNNQLTVLDLTDNLNLQMIYASENDLQHLDLSQKEKLTRLFVDNNQLTVLDLTDTLNLQMINASENDLQHLDLSYKEKLTYLFVDNNQIRVLDLTDTLNLQQVDISSNNLEHLDLSQQEILSYLRVSENQLTELDVSQNSNLSWLYASDNQITTVFGIEALNKQAAIQLLNNPLSEATEAYLTELKSQGYSNLYF